MKNIFISFSMDFKFGIEGQNNKELSKCHNFRRMCMNVDFNWTFENILNIYSKLHDFYTLPAQILSDNTEY